MKTVNPHSFLLSTAVFLLVTLACSVHCSARDISDFDRKLRDVRYTEWKDDTDSTLLEAKCLALRVRHNSPSEIGKIYSTIAFLYSDRGYGPGDDPNIAARAYHFSMIALEYPLEPLTACDLYTRAADALMRQARRDPNRPLEKIREEAIELSLKGLKLAIENDAPIEYPKPPDKVRNVGFAYEKRLEQLVQDHRHQAEAYEKWLHDVKFYWLRKGFIQRCISLSRHKPCDQETFEKKARQILKVYEKIAEELIDASDALEGTESDVK